MKHESGGAMALVVRDRGSLWLWLIPFVALTASGLLGYQAWTQRGPLISVEFADGSGIAAGDPVMYRGVRVGDVHAVKMKPDLTKVIVQARLRRDASNIASEGSEFWIVRPEISVGRVAGLDTLLGPRYLQCEPGAGKSTMVFAGLDHPPAGANQSGGLEVIVEANQRGSLEVGSPVVYRGIHVGTVRDLTLASDARKVEVTLLIEAQYRDLVRTNSRFWNMGGIGLDWGILRGLSVKAGSLESMVTGGIAFATPTKFGEAAESGRRFALADVPKEEWNDWSPAIELRSAGTASR
jgi:paraquat-inducible protein B